MSNCMRSTMCGERYASAEHHSFHSYSTICCLSLGKICWKKIHQEEDETFTLCEWLSSSDLSMLNFNVCLTLVKEASKY